MNKQIPPVLIVLVWVVIAGFMGSVCLSCWWGNENRNELESAYKKFLPRATDYISNRHYERQVIFTDSIERFRFDGADEVLVSQIVHQYDLSIVDKPLDSSAKAPDWWQLPESGIFYMRGSGNQYFMLVYDSDNGRVFFEATQD